MQEEPAGAPRRSARQTERRAAAAAASAQRAYGPAPLHACGLPFLTVSQLRGKAPHAALSSGGAFVLQLSSKEAEVLSELLAASRFLSKTAPPPGTKRVVEHRAGGPAPLPARVARKAAAAVDLFTALSKKLLSTLSAGSSLEEPVGFYSPTPCVLHPGCALSSLLDPSPLPAGRAASSPLTFLHYGAGSQAEAHTDRGLLTFVYAHEPGLHIWQPGDGGGGGAWLSSPSDPSLVLVMAGETLQLATSNALLACRHRVELCAAPRRAVAFRLRGEPSEPLPLAYGPFFRCTTVGALEAKFEATRRSVNAPPPPAAAAAEPAARSPAGAALAAASPAEIVLSVADLAGVIAAFLFAPMVGEGWQAAWQSNGRTLHAAERVCASLRAAVSPLWRKLYLGLVAGKLRLPRGMVQCNAAQWRHILWMRARPLQFVVRDQLNSEVTFHVSVDTPLEKIFMAVCCL